MPPHYLKQELVWLQEKERDTAVQVSIFFHDLHQTLEVAKWSAVPCCSMSTSNVASQESYIWYISHLCTLHCPCSKSKPSLPLFALQSCGSVPPLKVSLSVDSCPIDVEVDMGAAVSIVSQATFDELWPNRNKAPPQLLGWNHTQEKWCSQA